LDSQNTLKFGLCGGLNYGLFNSLTDLLVPQLERLVGCDKIGSTIASPPQSEKLRYLRN